MASYTIIKMTGITPIHVGTGRLTYDFSASEVCSDTLLSGLASMMAMTGKESDIKSFLENTRLSSAFPFYRDHLFLPTPKGRTDVKVDGEDECFYRKSLKRVKYMELPLWKQLIQGETVVIKKNQFCGDYIISPSTFLPTDIYKSEVSERVYVSRDGKQNSEPFFFEWKYFEKDSGLFVITDSTDNELTRLLELFELLGQQGLGTDKSVGGGNFSVTCAGEINIESPQDSNYNLLLSLYLPTSEEMKHTDIESSIYSLVLRGGFMAGSQHEEYRHLRKKSIYMLDVGSLLHCDIPLEGKVVDLRPEWNTPIHPAYRSGRPIYIPIKHIGYE